MKRRGFLSLLGGVLAAIKLPFESSKPITTITTTGTLNNYALGAVGTLRCNNASLLTITGIAADVDGQLLVIESVGAGQVDLSHQDSGSTAANRLGRESGPLVVVAVSSLPRS